MNVLVALAWPNHIHHSVARGWFGSARGSGWATCSVTESGFVRVSSNSHVIPDARPTREVLEVLRAIREIPGHVFWPDDTSPAVDEAGIFDRVVGYRQVTGAHLLTLAVRNGGGVATFDRGLRELAPAEHSHAVVLIGGAP